MGLRSILGLLPPKIGYATGEAPADTLPAPERVRLIWSGRVPGDLAVGVGADVVTGQNLAGGGRLFISTVTGAVADIRAFNEADGTASTLVEIAAAGDERLDPAFGPIEDPANADPAALLAAIVRAGFAEFGLLPSGARLKSLILSGADADPLTLVNRQALRDGAEQIPAAVETVRRALDPERTTLAVPRGLAGSARSLAPAGVEIAEVAEAYPAGLPEILAARGGGALLREREGFLFGDTIVIGLERLLAIHECVIEGKPHTEKTLTCAADAAGDLRNFRVRIGAPLSQPLERLGCEPPVAGKLIVNGPLRGYACFSPEQPVTAGVNSLLVQSAAQVHAYGDTACTNCGRCSAVCPVGLEVNLLGRFSEYDSFDKCEELGVENCIDCGLCSFVCPASRPLGHLLAHAKRMVRSEVREKQTLEEALSCQACGACSIRLFDFSSPDEDPSTKEERPS